MEFNVYLGDCIRVMEEMSDAVYDVVVTSPPYNLSIQYESYQDNLSMSDYLEWTSRWMAQVKRVLHPSGSFFLNVSGSAKSPWIPFDIANEARKLGWVLQNRIAWVKSIYIAESGKTFGHVKPINSDRFLNTTNEFIFHFTHSGDAKLNRYIPGVGVSYSHPSNLTRWNHNRTHTCAGSTWHIPYETIQDKNERGNHPAVFPLELPRRCLKLSGGRKVLDPFGGSGTTAKACLELGLNCDLIEIDKVYYNLTKDNIMQASKISK